MKKLSKNTTKIILALITLSGTITGIVVPYEMDRQDSHNQLDKIDQTDVWLSDELWKIYQKERQGHKGFGTSADKARWYLSYISATKSLRSLYGE